MRIDELEEILGIDSLVLFLERFGGSRVYIPTPEKLKPEHQICCPAGYEAAHRLSIICGGTSIDLPIGTRLKKSEIIRRRSSGESFDTIARSLKCSRRYVVRTCSEWQDGSDSTGGDSGRRQMELF